MKLEDLQPFCSVDETRYGLLQPFNHGPHTYATDGRVIVRVPKIEEIPDRKGLPKNPADVIPAGIGYKPVELPPNWENYQPTKLECKDCKGTGQQIKCRHCNGTGEVECESCGHEDNCEHCRGSGMAPTKDQGNSVECEECDGTGEYEKPFSVALNRGAVAVDLRYLRLVMKLPGVALTYLDELAPIRVDFDGGEGAMMTRRKSHDDAMTVAEQWPAVSCQNAKVEARD